MILHTPLHKYPPNIHTDTSGRMRRELNNTRPTRHKQLDIFNLDFIIMSSIIKSKLNGV